MDENGNDEPIDAENLQCGDMTKDGTWHAGDCANAKPYHCKLTPGIDLYLVAQLIYIRDHG